LKQKFSCGIDPITFKRFRDVTIEAKSPLLNGNSKRRLIMKKKLFSVAIASCFVVGLVFLACGPKGPETIKIGVNAPLSGDILIVGKGTKFAAQMWLEDVNAAGGIAVGGKKYKVELVIVDNHSRAESAVKAITKLVTEDEVVAIVGPQSSKQAVPAGGKANELETPMISPWSTNENTTKGRPFVFRGCFLDSFQGSVVAHFVKKEFGFTKAAVLYDVASDYPRGLAENFKGAWGKMGEVVASETFKTKDTDFSAQLTKIKDSGAEFLFAPQHYAEVPLIVRQAHQLDFNKPIVGSDSWASPKMVELCGEDCHGLFFSAHYAAIGAQGATKEFIDRYNQKHGYVPDDVAALTWDSLRIIQAAIEGAGELTGDIKKDRKAVRDALAAIKDFDGITGKLTFNEEGDPVKCAVMVRINDAGELEYYKSVCP
jgi:branched-chain amino acid transport system substrate-binding protein